MADMAGFHVLGVPGSLRARSLNRALLRAAAKLAPQGTSVEIFDLQDVPPYDEDRDEHRGGHDMPGAVARLRERLRTADAVLLASPESTGVPAG
jgi:chromate reductase, NAD(P)H dehydrogenase (quinone)